MATLRDVTFDCRHPASLARFWAAALDGYDLLPYDEAELARLRSLGIDDPEDDTSVILVGGGPRVCFQQVPEARSGKNRVHLDLLAVDVDDEVARLVALGARELQRRGEGVVLADPEGNELCVDPR
jgi:hypothetical protein